MPPELQPGDTLSHYQVLEQIGRGGMGTVYRARDTRLGRDVAIKVINAEIASDADRIARFRREATIVAALNHPAIVVIHDTGQEAGTSYLVTEFVDGVSLRTLLRDDKVLGYRRVIDIGAQIADARQTAALRRSSPASPESLPPNGHPTVPGLPSLARDRSTVVW